MSRNRCSTRCECEWWDFRFDARSPDAPDLMTCVEYKELVNTRYDPSGYGYPETREFHLRVPEEDRYRMAKLQCPVCFRLYAGWFVQDPWAVKTDSGLGPGYECYDTSFFWSYNDEPSLRDEEGALVWTRKLFLEALAEYRARHPGRVKTIHETAEREVF